MSTGFIVDVSEADFEYEVVSYSQNTPVVVDFWAEWCRPCKQISPLLEQFAREADGAFRLARLDVDANPNLALMYNVRSLPTVKAFSSGIVTGELVGLQSPARVREFLEHLLPPSPLHLAMEKADSLLDLRRWGEAETLYREVLETATMDAHSLLGLARALLAQGKAADAENILSGFPASREFAKAEALLPLAEAMLDFQTRRMPDESPLDAAFANCVRLAARGNLPGALDGLLDVLRSDKQYRGGLARRNVVALLELMGENDPQTRGYRAELASILF